DVQTLGVLEDYLEDFNGCVLVVSHDRYFLDRVVDSVFAFEGEGILREYPGNYSVYLEKKEAEEKAELKQGEQRRQGEQGKTLGRGDAGTVEVKGVPPKSDQFSAPPSAKPKKLSYKEKREYEDLETKIPAFEAEKAALEKRLYENPPSDYGEMQALSQQLADLSETIETSTERWLELAERAD
ncbi:MAG: ABC transporter ATP-binding protein, partial [Cyanobacteria bacterium P01_G01_bin.38]